MLVLYKLLQNILIVAEKLGLQHQASFHHIHHISKGIYSSIISTKQEQIENTSWQNFDGSERQQSQVFSPSGVR